MALPGFFDKFCAFITFLFSPAVRRTRVSFSPSTLHRELLHDTRLKASVNPFFNFLSEVRLQMMNRDPRRPPLRSTQNITKTASRLWKSMSEEEKLPYRMVAQQQRLLKRIREGRVSKPKRRRCVRDRRTSNPNLNAIPSEECDLMDMLETTKRKLNRISTSTSVSGCTIGKADNNAVTDEGPMDFYN